MFGVDDFVNIFFEIGNVKEAECVGTPALNHFLFVQFDKNYKYISPFVPY